MAVADRHPDTPVAEGTAEANSQGWRQVLDSLRRYVEQPAA